MQKLRLFPLAAALLTASLALPALAQVNRDESHPAAVSAKDSAKFIDMGELTIDAKNKMPLIVLCDPPPRIRFDFLLKLKKPLRAAMLRTAADKDLR